MYFLSLNKEILNKREPFDNSLNLPDKNEILR
jgi:hypothetical protein